MRLTLAQRTLLRILQTHDLTLHRGAGRGRARITAPPQARSIKATAVGDLIDLGLAKLEDVGATGTTDRPGPAHGLVSITAKGLDALDDLKRQEAP